MVQYNTTGALRRLCWYNKVLYEYWLGYAGRVEYYMSTAESVLVQNSTTGTLHEEAVLKKHRVLQDSGGCAGT